MDKNAICSSGWSMAVLAAGFLAGCVPAAESQRMFCWADVKTSAVNCTPILPGQILDRRIGSAGFVQANTSQIPSNPAGTTPSSTAASPSGVAVSSAGAVAAGTGSSAAASSAGAVASGGGSAAAASSAGVASTSGGASASASSAGVAVSN